MSENTNELENLPHQLIPVFELEPHPFNQEVYGDIKKTVTPEFIEDICNNKVQQTLLVTTKTATGKHRIVAGERRYWGALEANIPMLLCMVLPEDLSSDELYVKRRTIMLNHTQRDRNGRVKLNEIKALRKIHQEEAARSQHEGNVRGGQASGATRRGEAKSGVPGRQSSPKSGRTRERIAEELKTSPKNVERGLKVLDTIEEAKQAGDTERAKQLDDIAEKRGIKPAYEEATKPKNLFHN